MTYRIALSNQKGGVAKTTSCMSIGACLAEQGKRTLLVDLDPQAHLTISAGLDADELNWTVTDWLDGVGPAPAAGEVICPTATPGMDILPADIRLASLERVISDQPGYETRLADCLQPLAEQYDVLLFDCPPSLGPLTILALTAAQAALIPVPCEYFATRSLMRLLDIVAAVRQHTNPGLAYFLFVTLFDGRTLVSQRVLEQLKTHFPDTLLETVIARDTRLRECVMAGEAITSFAPSARGAQQYRQLSAEILHRLNAADGSSQ